MIDIPIPCINDERAKAYADHLREQEVDVRRVVGNTVYVPTTYPPFAWDIAEEAVNGGYGDDQTVARAVARKLSEVNL